MNFGRGFMVIGVGAIFAVLAWSRFDSRGNSSSVLTHPSIEESSRLSGARGSSGKSPVQKDEAKGLGQEDPKAREVESFEMEGSLNVRDLQFKEAARSFSANQFQLQGMESNRRKIAELAGNDEAVALAARTLSDTEWTRKEYGDNQAASRVLAIKVLGERARQGDLRPLASAVTRLGAGFSQLDRGQRADLRDLVTEFIQAVGPQRFFEDPSIVMQSFSNPSEVRKTVIAASIAHLGENINDPGFIQRMQRWR